MTTATAPATAPTIANYAAKSVRETATGAFSATLYRDGKRIGDVSNDGRGGPDFLHISDAAEAEAYLELARKLDPENDVNSEDMLTARLVTATVFGRKRGVVFALPEDGDPFETGHHRVLSGPRPTTIALLASHKPAARIFVPARGEFVPVSEAV